MPDIEVAQPPVADAASQQPVVNAEIAAGMAASLNHFLPQDKQIPVPAQAADQPPQGSVPRETVVETPPQGAAPVSQPVVQPEIVPFQFNTFTEKFGHKTPEETIKELEDLRAFKNTPGLPASFKDAEAAAIYKGVAEGNYDLLREHLNRQHEVARLSSLDVNKDTAADIVKFGMQLKHSTLTPEEINYKFNKQFAIPPKPVQYAVEEDTEYKERVDQWQQIATDKQMELMIEAKMIRPEFESAKKQFTFPKPIESSDEGYTQYQKQLENDARLQEETMRAYQALQPTQIATKLKFVDEPNKIDFEFQFEPDKESFGKTVETVSDIEKFGKLFQKPDGTPDREKFLKTIHYGLNLERYLIEAMTQAKNAAIKAQLPDNSQGGLLRQMPQGQEISEFDKNMQASMKV